MTVKDAAKLQGVSAVTIRNWIHAGRLPAVLKRAGKGNYREFRISREDYDRFAGARLKAPESQTLERESGVRRWDSHTIEC